MCLSFSVVIAGSGLVPSECSDSIMQFERSREVSLVKIDKLSGISVKRFEERLRDRSVLANGTKLLAEIEVKELSARLKYFRNLHLLAGKYPRPDWPKTPSL